MPNWESLNRRIVRCTRCPRLCEYCRRIAQEKRKAFAEWDYWGMPVPNFGDPRARLLIVGLAPAAHGANRTGRMFTGDRSGQWLYRALHKAGFANQADSLSADDGLRLIDCAITAAAHCAPPDNKPTGAELDNCSGWLNETLDLLPVRVIVALGGVAWRACIDLARAREIFSGARPRFFHGAEIKLGQDQWLVGSYHPSQQNTFTGRLSEAMLDDVFTAARRHLASKEAH